MGYPHTTVVYNSVVGYTNVEKNFSGPPTFWNDPSKKWVGP